MNDVLSKIDSKDLDPTNELIGIRVGYSKSLGRNTQSDLKHATIKNTKKKCC